MLWESYIVVLGNAMPVIYENNKPSLGKILSYAYKPLDSSGARLLRVMAYLAAGTTLFSVLGAVGSWMTVEEPGEPVKVAETTPAPKPKPRPDLTAAELKEFDLAVLELDPTQRMVTKVRQWEDSEIVTVTVGNDFIRTNQIQQGETAIAMRDALSKICECSPYLKFETDGGQRLVEIGRGQPKYKQ